MDLIRQPLNFFKGTINNHFSGKEPWQIVTITTSTVLITVWLYELIHQDESLAERGKKYIFKMVRLVPKIRKKIEDELQKVSKGFEDEVRERTKHLKYMLYLPENGLGSDDILKQLQTNLGLGDYNWKNGSVSGTVYYHNPELISMLGDVYKQTSYTNPLHPDIFPGLCKMEAEVIRISANLFHGDEEACGTLAGSAPNFPYGTMDDIQAISELGLKYDIPVHVDSCLGGFLSCFMEDAGYPIPLCDFRLPGVTSISADTHKYGFTPKGSSVVLYRHKKYRHYQYTVTTDWPGGVYGSPSVGGSRAGGNIAVCWATMLSFGKAGYVKATRDIIHTTKYIEKGLKRIKGIYVFGQPVTSVIAIGSYDFDIYRLSTALKQKGWSLNNLQFPPGIHICVTHMHVTPGVADRFIEDVKSSIAEIMKDPSLPVEGNMAIYGAAQQIPDRSIVGDFTRLFLDTMYYVPKNNLVNGKH
nr:unnamed protein product [Callosobruchus analis]